MICFSDLRNSTGLADSLSRDDYLATADFFDTDVHPGITFKSTEVSGESIDRLEVTGELNMLGVVRPVSFVAEKVGEGRFGKSTYKIGYEAVFTIKRSDFGMTYGIPGVAGDEVRLVVAVECDRDL